MSTYLTPESFAPPCMGGWCAIRETCHRYHAASPLSATKPAERLCAPATHSAFKPIAFHRVLEAA